MLAASALTGAGLDEVWAAVQDCVADEARVQDRRRAQTGQWFEELLREAAWQALASRLDMAEPGRVRARVNAGELTPVQGVSALLEAVNPDQRRKGG